MPATETSTSPAAKPGCRDACEPATISATRTERVPASHTNLSPSGPASENVAAIVLVIASDTAAEIREPLARLGRASRQRRAQQQPAKRPSDLNEVDQPRSNPGNRGNSV